MTAPGTGGPAEDAQMRRADLAVANMHKIAAESIEEDHLALRARIRALATQWEDEPATTGAWCGRYLLDVLDKEYPAVEDGS